MFESFLWKLLTLLNLNERKTRVVFSGCLSLTFSWKKRNFYFIL